MMRRRRILVMAAALAVITLLFTGVQNGIAYAVEGWIKEGGQWSYLDKNDKPETNVWRQSKDSWYYLGTDGKMVKNSFVGQGDGIFYVNGDGRRLADQWFLNTADDGNGHKEGWYYFGKDGKAYHKASARFIMSIGGKQYAFDENGLMLTGWIDGDGIPLSPQDNPLEIGYYFADKSGGLYTGKWLSYSDLHVDGTEPLKSSFTDKNYNEYDKLWLYFGGDSKKVMSTGSRLKQIMLDGKTYAFDEYGIMLPWWSQVGSVNDADKSNPTTDVAPRFYSGDEGGALSKNQWLWMYPSENLDAKDYASQKYSWWFTDSNGKVYQDKVAKINNRYYAFDGLGRMQTGFTLYDGRNHFVAQYDPGTWSSEAFWKGGVYGIDKADLYFFSPDELNDGSMKTGDVDIELSDGVHTFGFASNGVAYGSRNRLQRVKDSFYINGLRLTGDKDYGYGVLAADASNGDYRVVTVNGNLVEGKRNVIKDKEGGWFIVINGRFAARVTDDDKPRWIDGDMGPGYYHYNKYSENPYEDGFIAGYDTPAVIKNLPEEIRLNF